MYQVKKPWGAELVWAQTDKYIAKFLTIEPGEKLSRQYHKVKDETIYVLSGELAVEIGKGDDIENFLMMPKTAFRVEPMMVHRFSCNGSQKCILVEVSTPEMDDIVRLEDAYGRVEE